MSTIYELKHEQELALEELQWCEDDEQIHAVLDRINGDVKRKVNFVSSLLIEAIGQTELAKQAKKLAIERHDKQVKRKEKIEQKLEDYIVNAMFNFDIKKMECDLCNVTISMSPGKVVLGEGFDSSRIPADCIEVIPAQVKTLLTPLAKHLRSGEVIDGAVLVKEPCLRIS